MTALARKLAALDDRVLGRIASEASLRRYTARMAIVTVGASVGVCVASGAAVAYWSAPGVGAGSAVTGSVALTATAVTSAGLYPDASVPVTVSVKNNSATASLKITSLQAGATQQTAGNLSCNASSVSFVAGTLPTTPLTPGGSVDVPGTVTMSLAALNECQGATFSIPLTAQGQTP